MLLSVINDVINDYYHPELIKLYRKILIDLDFKLTSLFNSEYILSNYKKFDNLKFDNHNMVLVDENQNFATKDKIIFNPIDDNVFSCSFLTLEDGIHNKLSILVNNIFEAVIGTKLNIYRGNISLYQYLKDIHNLPITNKYTLYKWKNLYNIITSNLNSKNIISFSFEYSNDSPSAQIKFDYPFYNYLLQIQSGEIFGIKFTNSEIELLKKIYEIFIINILEKRFKSPIYVPQDSNKSPKFYIYLKFYMLFKELLAENYRLRLGYYKFFNIRIDKLNDYNYTIKESCNINIFEKIKKLDKQVYENELKIREESNANLLLLKDNSMAKNGNIVIQEEINKKFEKEYFNAYNQKLASYFGKKDAEAEIFNREYLKNSNDFRIILDMQRLTLKIIQSDGGLLFFDNRDKKYYFRSDSENSITPYDKKDILVILNKAMQKNLPKYHNYNKDSLNHSIEVALIENLNDVPKEKLKNEINTSYTTKILIFTNQIPSIDGEVFDLSRNEEIFQSKTDLLFKRNIFVTTKFLAKRKEYDNKNTDFNKPTFLERGFRSLENEDFAEKNTVITKSFIKKFIYQMVNKNTEKTEYIINWLAYYFQNLKKTGTALVLLGDSEVTEKLFFNLIIKKIFGNRYCSTINDTEYKTSLLQDVAKYKLFFNVADIKNAGTKFDDDTLALLVKDLLIHQTVEYTNDKGDEDRVEIHGQLLITATNPSPYLKKSLSKCTVIETVNIDKIMESLELEDEIELEDKILKDLDIFSDLLNNYSVKDEIAEEKFITEEREKLKGITTSNVDKNAIEDSLDKFIEAIKNKDIEYFEKVKNIDNGTIYEHLKNAFEKDDGYFIGQDLLVYYNTINEQKFDNKKDLMDKLKAKDNMFLQEVKTLKILTSDKKEEVLFQAYKTSKETGNKELYKINDYVMAKDIEILYGAVITTSQDNIKKYHHSDLENAIKINKEYKDKKAQEKENK